MAFCDFICLHNLRSCYWTVSIDRTCVIKRPWKKPVTLWASTRLKTRHTLLLSPLQSRLYVLIAVRLGYIQMHICKESLAIHYIYSVMRCWQERRCMFLYREPKHALYKYNYYNWFIAWSIFLSSGQISRLSGKSGQIMPSYETFKKKKNY